MAHRFNHAETISVEEVCRLAQSCINSDKIMNDFYGIKKDISFEEQSLGVVEKMLRESREKAKMIANDT